MAEERKLTEEEKADLAPSDRAHYEIKGRTGDGFDTEDTDATKAAREAAFGKAADKASEDAKPDDSSKSASTKAPKPKKE